MKKNIYLTPTMNKIINILTDYTSENKPKEFDLLEIFSSIRSDYNLEICLHSLKEYLDILSQQKKICCLKRNGKYRLKIKKTI